MKQEWAPREIFGIIFRVVAVYGLAWGIWNAFAALKGIVLLGFGLASSGGITLSMVVGWGIYGTGAAIGGFLGLCGAHKVISFTYPSQSNEGRATS